MVTMHAKFVIRPFLLQSSYTQSSTKLKSSTSLILTKEVQEPCTRTRLHPDRKKIKKRN